MIIQNEEIIRHNISNTELQPNITYIYTKTSSIQVTVYDNFLKCLKNY